MPTCLIAIAFALAVFVTRRSRTLAGVAALLVVGHWMLDAVSHPPDMPLAPGLAWRAGLGLWTSISATVLVEGALWLASIVLFARRVGVRGIGRRITFVAGALVITLVWISNIAGPPPPDPRLAPIMSLVLFSLIVAWAYAIEPWPRR